MANLASKTNVQRSKRLAGPDHVRPLARKTVGLSADVQAMDWYALTTAPQQEEKAAYLLRERGFDALCLQQRVWRRRNRRQRAKRVLEYRPMLTSMILFGSVRPVPWLFLFDVPYVTGVVGFGGAPSRIPPQAVVELLDKARIEAKQRKPLVEADDNVRVLEGPFEGYDGKVVECVDGVARVRLHLSGPMAERVRHGEVAMDENMLEATG